MLVEIGNKSKFNRGDIVLQILDCCRVQHYYVEHIISDLKIRARAYDENGILTSSSRTFFGSDLDTLILDAVATRMRNELNERESIHKSEAI